MTLRYVALGDSYTIGISVARSDAWPEQLVAALGNGPDGLPRLNLLANLATNGRTSRDVLRDQLSRAVLLDPQFVSLLIGVNDVVQGVSRDAYRVNLVAILDRLLALLPAHRLLTVTTPDYTVTPAGARFGDPAVQHARIEMANAILVAEAAARRIACVDIWAISGRAAAEPELVAHDGLHPSARQYALWLGQIGPVVQALLDRGRPTG
ncbi:MAG: SGNH/GDSL hydrolase family protein [Candidatus Limnocylindrales bacterium]